MVVAIVQTVEPGYDTGVGKVSRGMGWCCKIRGSYGAEVGTTSSLHMSAIHRVVALIYQLFLRDRPPALEDVNLTILNQRMLQKNR